MRRSRLRLRCSTQTWISIRLVQLQHPIGCLRQVTGHGTSGSNELISINTALGQVVNPSDVKFICFLVRSRLASDRVEMVHHRLGATTVSVPVVGVIQ